MSETLKKNVLLLLRSSVARRVSTVIAFLFTVAIFGIMVFREKDVLLNQHWSINWLSLLAAFFCDIVALLLVSYVWVEIIQSMGAKTHFWQHLKYYSISMLAKRLPGTIWYVAYRSQMYGKDGISPKVTSLASGIEFAIVLISGMIVSLLFAGPILTEYKFGFAGIIIFFVVGIGILHPRVLKWFFVKLKIETELFNYWQVVWWVFVYVIVRLIAGVLVFFIANIVYSLPISTLGYFIGAWTLVGVLSSALIFLPTNMGFTEVTLSLLLTNIMPSSMAVVVAVLTRIIITLFEIVWASSLLLTSKNKREPS